MVWSQQANWATAYLDELLKCHYTYVYIIELVDSISRDGSDVTYA